MDVALDEKLRLILRDHIKNITIKNAALFSVFFAEENHLPKDDFEKIRAKKRKYSLIIEDIIKEGISRGIFRSAEPRLHANAILGMCNWVYKWYRRKKQPIHPMRLTSFITLINGSGFLPSSGIIQAWPIRKHRSKLVRISTRETKKQIHQKKRSYVAIFQGW